MAIENQDNTQKILRSLRGRNIIAPIVLGFAVVVYLFWDEFDLKAFKLVTFTSATVAFIICAFGMMLLRDIGYIIRIKILAGNSLTWKQCTRIIFLWEFASAVTPSAVGGTSVAVFFLYKEKISMGKSTAIVMATAFLDELYFLCMFPLMILIFNSSALFSVSTIGTSGSWQTEFLYFAIIGYSLKALFTILIFYGLFINPRGAKVFLFTIFKLRFLRKWQRGVVKTGNDLVLASHEFKSKPFIFWVKAFASTFVSWTARYWVVNFIFLAFFVVPDHFIIFAKQLVMWIMMIVSPTPGGSGFSEFIFSQFLGEFIPYVTLVPILAILWRLISYYPYLFIGVFLIPMWIKNKFSKQSSEEIQ